jgi:hypothetical protein
VLLVHVAYLRDPLAKGLNVDPLDLLIALCFAALSYTFTTAAIIIVAHGILRPVDSTTLFSLKLSGVCDLQCQLCADAPIFPDEALNLLAEEAKDDNSIQKFNLCWTQECPFKLRVDNEPCVSLQEEAAGDAKERQN